MKQERRNNTQVPGLTYSLALCSAFVVMLTYFIRHNRKWEGERPTVPYFELNSDRLNQEKEA